MTIATIKTNFINVLRKQTEYYKELKNIILTESDGLNNKQTVSLEKLLNQEENILNKIKSIELEKQNLFKDLVKELGFKVDTDIKLKEILFKLPQNDSKEIEEAIVALLQVVKEIEDINSKNIHIIKNYLNYFDFFKKIREKAEKKENITYNSAGAKKIDTEKQSAPKIDKTI